MGATMTLVQTTECSSRANTHSDDVFLLSNKGSNFIKQEIYGITEKIDQVRKRLFASRPSVFDGEFAALKEVISVVTSELQINLLVATTSQDVEFYVKKQP